MNDNSNLFINKRILIYGLGKSGVSSFKFLKKRNKIYLFDDKKNLNLDINLKKNIISHNQINRNQFDLIIISPGIDIDNCRLSKFLKKNLEKIYTDFDIFNSFYNNTCITITGTNGKSTTCELLYQILKNQKYDVRLAGNIGYPILSIKNINKKTIFVVEASSYQLEYSKLFWSKYAVILNISPDHLERHDTLKKYISAKFKLIKNQNKNSFAFVNKYDENINKMIKKNEYKSKIIKVNTKISNKFANRFENKYFLSASNKENLSFVIEIAKKLNLKNKNLVKTIKGFKGLNYRQQVIFRNKNISIINDSKSTSYSSSVEMLRDKNKIYWLIGGIPKKGDNFKMTKDHYRNINGYIFGANQKKFYNDLKNKINLKKFLNLKRALKELFKDIKKDKFHHKKILFSPAAASFDNFKNFEHRGEYFNKIIRKFIHEI